MRQFVCPECGAVNRTPEARDPAAAKCGRCGTKLFQGKPHEVTAAQFAAHRKSNVGAAVLVDVWASWCGPCRAMAPQFAAAAAQLEPRVRLLKLDSEAEPSVASDLRVSGIPLLVLFRDGREVARQAGAMGASQIVAWVNQALAQADA